MATTNKLAEFLPSGLAAARPVAPGTGVYLYYATDTGAVSIWDGAAWRAFGGGGAPSGAAGGDLGDSFPNPTVRDLTIASEARGDLLRRGASAWERVAAKAVNTFVGGDGTDVVVRTAAQTRASIFSQTVDGLSGTSWTTTADPSTAWVWTAATRGRATITGGATGLVTVEHATFLPSAEEYDLCVNLDVSGGDGSAGNTKQIVVRAGQSSSSFWYVALRGDGQVEVGSIDGGGALTPRSMSAVAAIDSTARTGGALWLRLCRRAGRLVALYGISSGAGVLPTVWIELYRSDNTATYTTDKRTFTASQGTWVELVVYAPTSMVANYEVDFTAIRGVIGGGPL